MPTILDCSLDELQEKARNCLATYTDTIHKYDEAKEKKEENLQDLADIEENYEHTSKKLDFKTHQCDLLVERLHTEQSTRYEIQQKLKKLIEKSHQFTEHIATYKENLKQLTKKKPKVNDYFISVNLNL